MCFNIDFQLKCMAEGVAFDEAAKPGYDEGRELVVEPQTRGASEIMQNNGTFRSEPTPVMPEEEKKEPQPAQQSSGGWFSNPMVGKLWNSGASVLKTGGALIGTMGVAMQQKLEEAGIQQKVSTFVNVAKEKTVEVTNKTLEVGS